MSSTSQHRTAVLVVIAATLMWSLGGVASRQAPTVAGFELTFWRSLIAALTVAILLPLTQGREFASKIRDAGRTVWICGLCWAVMFSCFMMALSLTTVANVLITQCLAPVVTALLTWAVFRKPLGLRLWAVIAVACSGIALMYITDVGAMGGKHLLGVLVALGIPAAAAVNFVTMQKSGKSVDLSAAVLIGGAISALAMLPLAMPFKASGMDFFWVTLLGVVQLGVPCVMVVWAARHLPAPELSLLCLLEVIFGIVWALVFVGERPGLMTLVGGAMVLGALAVNEFINLRRNQVGQGAVPMD